MTLGVNKTAVLDLNVEMAGKKKDFPTRIYMKVQDNSNTDLFSFEADISSPTDKKTYTGKITCNKKFFMDQYIDFIAVYPDDEDGSKNEMLCGQLMILPNYRTFDTVNLLLVQVKTKINRNLTLGECTNQDSMNINKILNQALLKVNITDTLTLDIDANKIIKDPNGTESGKLINNVRDGSYSRTGGTLQLCLFALETQLIDALKNRLKTEIEEEYKEKIDNAYTESMRETIRKEMEVKINFTLEEELRTNHPMSKYRNCYKIFFLGDNFSYVKTTTDGDMEYKNTTKTKGYAIKDLRSAVIYKNKDHETTVHELLHAIGLDHSFAPKNHCENALYTYEAEKTDNIMDYSSKRYTTWYWQWKILWQNLFFRSYNDNTNRYA